MNNANSCLSRSSSILATASARRLRLRAMWFCSRLGKSSSSAPTMASIKSKRSMMCALSFSPSRRRAATKSSSTCSSSCPTTRASSSLSVSAAVKTPGKRRMSATVSLPKSLCFLRNFWLMSASCCTSGWLMCRLLCCWWVLPSWMRHSSLPRAILLTIFSRILLSRQRKSSGSLNCTSKKRWFTERISMSIFLPAYSALAWAKPVMLCTVIFFPFLTMLKKH